MAALICAILLFPILANPAYCSHHFQVYSWNLLQSSLALVSTILHLPSFSLLKLSLYATRSAPDLPRKESQSICHD